MLEYLHINMGIKVELKLIDAPDFMWRSRNVNNVGKPFHPDSVYRITQEVAVEVK
jgi:hypothetical protein